MKSYQVYAAKRDELPEIHTFMDTLPGKVTSGRGTTLESMSKDDCLLIARSLAKNSIKTATAAMAGKLLGVIGLDLSSRSINLLGLRRGVDSAGILADLLNGVERLAVSFGMTELQLATSRTMAKQPAFSAYDLIQQDGSNSILQRNLGRRLTRDARKVRQYCLALGVPDDYGCRRRLHIQPEPSQLSTIGPDVFNREQFMTPAAANAFLLMQDAALADGITLQAVSAFRSMDYQAGLVERKLAAGQHMKDILRVSAAPGYSEHHSGRAVDITSPGYEPLEEVFAESPAYAWLKKHAAGFGFRMSYPARNRHGVAYEPWHWYFKRK